MKSREIKDEKLITNLNKTEKMNKLTPHNSIENTKFQLI